MGDRLVSEHRPVNNNIALQTQQHSVNGATTANELNLRDFAILQQVLGVTAQSVKVDKSILATSFSITILKILTITLEVGLYRRADGGIGLHTKLFITRAPSTPYLSPSTSSSNEQQCTQPPRSTLLKVEAAETTDSSSINHNDCDQLPESNEHQGQQRMHSPGYKGTEKSISKPMSLMDELSARIQSRRDTMYCQ